MQRSHATSRIRPPLAWLLLRRQRFLCAGNDPFALVPFGYFPLPKFYEFESEDAKERVLYNNFNRIDREVKEMIKEIQTEFKV
mgnify:CR=1 FL=1